jgi:hypothetical protein
MSTKQLPQGAVWDRAKKERNWFVYKISPEDEIGKSKKVPCSPPHAHSTGTVSAAKMTFSEAVAAQRDMKTRIGEINTSIDAVNAKRATGKEIEMAVDFCVGYLPRPGSAMVIFDWDGVIDGDGEVAEWLADCINETYAEISASGTGLHYLSERAPVDQGIIEKNQAGLYANDSRGVALTFNRLEGSPLRINGALKARQIVRERAGKAHDAKTKATPRRMLPEDMVKLDAIPDILNTLPNDTQNYDEWVRMAHALKAAADDADTQTAMRIEQAFYDWSGRLKSGDLREDPARVWNSIKTIRSISAGSFFFIAREMGWSPRAPDKVPVNINLEVLIRRAMAGDADALQRISRFALGGFSEDVAFRIVTTLGKIGKHDADEVKLIVRTEENRRDERAAADMAGIGGAGLKTIRKKDSWATERWAKTMIDALPKTHLKRVADYIARKIET